MARDTITLTDEWQLLASGPALFTVLAIGAGNVLFNTSESDVDAYEISANNTEYNLQLEQRADVDTYARVESGYNANDVWRILMDTDT